MHTPTELYDLFIPGGADWYTRSSYGKLWLDVAVDDSGFYRMPKAAAAYGLGPWADLPVLKVPDALINNGPRGSDAFELRELLAVIQAALFDADNIRTYFSHYNKILLRLGAEPRAIPKAFYDLFCRDLPEDRSSEEEIHNLDDDNKRWCSAHVRAYLAKSLSLSQRYDLYRSSKVKPHSGREKELLIRQDAEEVPGLPQMIVPQSIATRWLKNKQLVTLAKIRGSHDGSPLNNSSVRKAGCRYIVFMDEFEKTSKDIHNTVLLHFQNDPLQIRDEEAQDKLAGKLCRQLRKEFSDTSGLLSAVASQRSYRSSSFRRRSRPEQDAYVGSIRIRIENDATVCSIIARDYYGKEIGARSIAQAVERIVQDPLISQYLENGHRFDENQPIADFNADVNVDKEVEDPLNANETSWWEEVRKNIYRDEVFPTSEHAYGQGLRSLKQRPILEMVVRKGRQRHRGKHN
ncbi:hypothetical protein DL764_007577 [Monosporascus ibericus]|uniref:Clp ATPase C-terminal domain-containing protein n=1 Tax=Monosporascus ibericus TaxID=155417 RepID=A0A4V1X9I5_9PEZI|nr:hypothetical protein DL764_007577 [Monosporascus ibericus]